MSPTAISNDNLFQLEANIVGGDKAVRSINMLQDDVLLTARRRRS